MSFSRRAAPARPRAGPARPLAGWWTRGGALAIDLSITVSIELALLLIVWAVNGSPRWTLAHAERIIFEVGLPAAVLYAPLLLGRSGARNGQTVGKQVMGIRVIRQDGLPMTFATALVREGLGRQVPALLSSGLYVPVDYLWPLWDRRNQSLHDKVGRTFVVAAPGSAPGPQARAEAEDPGVPELVLGEWLPPVAPALEPSPERADVAPGPS
ncbi:MAG TPA: RDD family protein [Solirubrobacteraceae bacterium]|nr:RDD family protein [Solirubrobacteraceae bacterium]